ncbi:hypothetical protein DFH09DRAFT_1498241 [Mycena vulgaris]|nr:hypothetical protein DFH09DRAFT_1498241 [Mycena vulgaris]
MRISWRRLKDRLHRSVHKTLALVRFPRAKQKLGLTSGVAGTFAARLPQELWEEIIQCLESEADWESCSLVSRGFRNISQYLLFEMLYFEDNPWPRFKLVAQESPHLIHYIRPVKIYRLEALDFLCSLRIPQLRHISLGLGDPPPSAIKAAQMLISLESVRGVEIRGYVRDMNIIPTIFQMVSPHLQALELDISGAPDIERPIQHLPCLRERPTVISRLEIGAQSRLTQWLLHSPDFFDLTQLTDVRFWSPDSLSIDVAQLLHTARLTIESLSFSPDIMPQLDLSQFPRLRNLTLDSYKQLQNVVPVDLLDLNGDDSAYATTYIFNPNYGKPEHHAFKRAPA